MGIKNISYELAEKVIEIGEAISLMTPDWDQFVIRKEDVKRLKSQKKEMDKEQPNTIYDKPIPKKGEYVNDNDKPHRSVTWI